MGHARTAGTAVGRPVPVDADGACRVQSLTPMKNPTSALELLTSQHEEVDDLIAALEAGDDDAQKEAIFQELADKLAAHASVEEQLFYPWVKSRQTEDMLLEAVEEHLAIKRILADLLDLGPSDEQFDAKLSVMKEELEHHAHEEEEGKLFPLVRKVASAAELEALGGEMLALFEKLLATEPRLQVPGEIDHAAPV